MKKENKFKQDPTKKNFPTTFLLFLFAVVLLVVTVQNFMTTKTAKVAFSHQVEHLVNLNLIAPEESRKVSLNDNLVTFSGKFRERETEEGKKRYKYLELLDENHSLKREQEETASTLDLLSHKIHDAGVWFLQISGTPVPQGGYRIVGDAYNLPDRENAIVLKDKPAKEMVSLKELKARWSSLKAQGQPLDEEMKGFETNLLALIENFRSPVLGIGAEATKQELKTLYKEVQDVTGLSMESKVPVYDKALQSLQTVVDRLNQPIDDIRLSELRSVRQYKEELSRYSQLGSELEQNEAQLEKARAQVASVIWFFNNHELSTRALEKQDAEEFSHWFAGAKEEWENFKYNQGLHFKAPDQPRNLVLEKTFKR
jgi:cell division protease FtsH